MDFIWIMKYSTISEEDIEADGYVDLEEGDCRLLIT